MKVFSAVWLFVFAISVSNPCFSQKQVEIAGVKYILHNASKDESVFSICQKYKVSQADILKANPGLPAVLKAGTTVKIPAGTVAAETKKVEQPVAQSAQPTADEYYYHKVAPKQTIFTIAKQYGITVNDLIRYNPEITKGISPGQVLNIPVNITKGDTNSAQPDVSEYNVHPVVSGETLYSLEQRYGISHEEMMKFNPALQNGLKTGMKLKIPVKKAATELVETASPIEEKNLTKYKVEKGETLFSLAARFGVEVDDIKKANPSLFSRSIEAGETILIPKQPTVVNENENKVQTSIDQKVEQTSRAETQSSDCSSLKVNPKQKYKAALLLPFYLAGNDNPSGLNKEQIMSKINIAKQVVANPADTAVVYSGVNIDQKALGFLEFYEGALLAVDSLQRAGMNIELFAFDVSNQKMINALLQMDEMRDMNLIIGPVYPELQETVASFAAKNRIPMVSPLASTGTFEQNNSWYFKVNPSREYQLEQTALYVEKELGKRNYVMLQYEGNPSSADAQLGKLCREKLASGDKGSFHEYNLQQRGLSEINTVMSETTDNVFFIPTDNEAQVSMAITNLNTLSEKSNVLLVGSPMLAKLKSIQPENFHRVRLRYLSPYFVNYAKPLVRRMVGQYREIYSAEPSQFSFQGFDVAFYFMSALQHFGKDFRNCLPEYRQELTQMNFSISKVSPMGGFTNQSLFVTSYERNYDLLDLGTFTNGSFTPRN